VYFGKQEEHDALVQDNERRLRIKAMWNGTKVGEWTSWHGWLVGRLMKYMRETVGEEKIGQMTEEELKERVLQAKEVIESELAQERQISEDDQADVNVETSHLEVVTQ
jgi:hypothetical protein